MIESAKAWTTLTSTNQDGGLHHRTEWVTNETMTVLQGKPK